MASLLGNVGTGTKEVESSTGHFRAAGFHHVTARSHLARVLKLINLYLFNFSKKIPGSSKPQIIETADTESANTGGRLYLEILDCGTPENKYVGNLLMEIRDVSL